MTEIPIKVTPQHQGGSAAAPTGLSAERRRRAAERSRERYGGTRICPDCISDGEAEAARCPTCAGQRRVKA